MPEKISIMKESGEMMSSNIVSVFMIPDTQKKYIITTENAVDPHGLTVLHVSELVKNDEDLVKVATDEEWSSIKTIMRAIISGNVGSYQYVPSVERVIAKGQYSRDISVSATAAKQMVDNYNAASKDLVEVKKEIPAVEAENNSDSIFPSNNVVSSDVNEVSPGIAEVSNQGVESKDLVSTVDDEVVPSIMEGVVTENSPVDTNISTEKEVVQEVSEPVKEEAVSIAAEKAEEVAPVVSEEPKAENAGQSSVIETPKVEEVAQPVASVEPTVQVSEVVAEQSDAQPVVEKEEVTQEGQTVEPVVAPVEENVEQENTVSEVAKVESSSSQENVVDSKTLEEPVITQIQEKEDNSSNEEVVAMDTPVVAVAEPAVAEESSNDDVSGLNEEVSSRNSITDIDIQSITDMVVKKISENQNEGVTLPKEAVVTNINFDATPSFAPSATLDEVVVGAQDLFIASVKNLVQTMTEKVYRDLYQREAQLREREELLNQREKLLNDQLAMLVKNYSTIQSNSVSDNK